MVIPTYYSDFIVFFSRIGSSNITSQVQGGLNFLGEQTFGPVQTFVRHVVHIHRNMSLVLFKMSIRYLLHAKESLIFGHIFIYSKHPGRQLVHDNRSYPGLITCHESDMLMDIWIRPNFKVPLAWGQLYYRCFGQDRMSCKVLFVASLVLTSWMVF